jgi:hypothetical protein
VVAVVGAAAAAGPPASYASAGPRWTIVGRHLDNPRGVGFTSAGRLVVAESGHAGTKCLSSSQLGQYCAGLTSKISAINLTTKARKVLASGLPSAFFPFEPFGLGGVSVSGQRIFAVTALPPQEIGSPAAACTGMPPSCKAFARVLRARVGLLIRVGPSGGWSTVAKVGAFNYRWVVRHNPDPGNPDFNPGDADPYGVLAADGGAYVVDGGSNTLSFVRNGGKMKVLAYVPDPPGHQPVYDAVPTCLAKARGSIFIGTLAGSLWRWHHGRLTEAISGGKLTAIVGCTSDRWGNLYLVNLTQQFNAFNPAPATGSIVKVRPDMSTSYVVAPDQGLNYPNGITFGPGGALYVSINSLCPADLSLLTGLGLPPDDCPNSGQVIRLRA